MPRLTVEGFGTFDVPEGKRMVLALGDEAGVDQLHACGGNARCTTCRVEVMAGELAPMEELERERLAREENLEPNVRLSCQVRVEGDLTVRVLGRASERGVTPGPRPAD